MYMSVAQTDLMWRVTWNRGKRYVFIFLNT